MGILDFVRRPASVMNKTPLTLPFNPYSTSTLPQIVVADLMPDEQRKLLPLDRTEAMTIPAVSKSRNLLVSTIAKFPLRAIRRNADGTETDVTLEHPWLYRTNTAVTPYERLAWTIDDFIFYGVSLWLIERGAPDSDKRRPILNAEWCSRDRWTVQAVDGTPTMVVDGVPLAESGYILINTPFEGLLTVGRRTLKGARDVEDAWVGRARNPIPLIELHVSDDSELEDDEIEEFVDSFAKARISPNGAIGYTPKGVTLETHGEVKAELMLEGRNAIRTDVGSHLNIRASMIDGTAGVDSLTYSTTQGEKNSFYEFDLPFWTDPFAARLSLDDIVPRGTRIRFDMYEAFNQPTPTGAPVED